MARLLVENRTETLDAVRRAQSELRPVLDGLGAGDDQSGRVADRLALVMAVGIVACEEGILPWGRTSIRTAMVGLFESWRDARGGDGSQEALAAVHSFTKFVFSQTHRGDFPGLRVAMRDRAFVCLPTDDSYAEYWFPDLTEACGQAHRVEPFLTYLAEGRSEEWELIADADRKKKRRQRTAPAGHGLSKRAYCIRSKSAASYKALAGLADYPLGARPSREANTGAGATAPLSSLTNEELLAGLKETVARSGLVH